MARNKSEIQPRKRKVYHVSRGAFDATLSLVETTWRVVIHDPKYSDKVKEFDDYQEALIAYESIPIPFFFTNIGGRFNPESRWVSNGA